MHVLISGGSVGGLIAAHALLQADCDVTVYEQSPTIKAAGAVRNLGSLQSACYPVCSIFHQPCSRAVSFSLTDAYLQGISLDARVSEIMTSYGLQKEFNDSTMDLPIEINHAVRERQLHTLFKDPNLAHRRYSLTPFRAPLLQMQLATVCLLACLGG